METLKNKYLNKPLRKFDFLKKVYLRIFPNYYILLDKEIKGCKSILDVGCGSSSPIRGFSNKIYSVGVDLFKPSIEKSKKEGIHNKYYQADILKIDKQFKPNSFDCVLASDVIEHLGKKEGILLLKNMEKIAKKRVIVFTPNEFIEQGEIENNPFQIHKSHWTVKEMNEKGYSSMGVGGHKIFKGKIRLLTDISQKICKKLHEKAWRVLYIKDL